MFQTVYRTDCLLNGTFYIGIHSTKDPNDSYLGSGYKIKRSIKLYGRAQHVKTILAIAATRREALAMEKKLVAPVLRHPLCLNLIEGGKIPYRVIRKFRAKRRAEQGLAPLKRRRRRKAV